MKTPDFRLFVPFKGLQRRSTCIWRLFLSSTHDTTATFKGFTCPEGRVLTMKHERQEDSCVYQGVSEVCVDCPFQSRCSPSAKGESRTITTDNKEPLCQQMNSKMATESAKVIYGKRKMIVEPVFGQIRNSGFSGFNVRGKVKVAGEFSMVCAAHNFKKIPKAILTGLIRPAFGIFTRNPAI